MGRKVRLVSSGSRTRSGSFGEYALTQMVELVAQMLQPTGKLLSVNGRRRRSENSVQAITEEVDRRHRSRS